MLIISWLAVHISGRIQVLLLWPMQQRIHQVSQQIVVQQESPAMLLASDALRRQQLQLLMKSVEQRGNIFEVFIFQFLPLGSGLLCRLVLIRQLLPEVAHYAALFALGSIVLIWGLSMTGSALVRQSTQATSALYHQRTEAL